MHTANANGPVLVGASDPEHVQQLVRTAGDLAHFGGGTVRLVTVAVKSYDSPVSVYDDETIVREYAEESTALLEGVTPPPGVRLEREVLVARSVEKGLLAAVESSDPAALVVGWRGRSRRSEAVLGTTVDALVERAGCDLYVERVGREADGVETVLLPVAGGPHVEVAADAAAAIAARNDARVLAFSVATPDVGITAAERFVTAARRAVAAAPGPDVPVTGEVRQAENAAAAIAEETADHDVTVLGATRQGRLRRRVVGSVPRRVVAATDATTVLARDADVVGGPLAWIGERLWR